MLSYHKLMTYSCGLKIFMPGFKIVAKTGHALNTFRLLRPQPYRLCLYSDNRYHLSFTL